MIVTISGQTPSQKNRKKISTVGRTPRLYTAKNVKDWQDLARQELRKQYSGHPINHSVEIVYTFYVGDNRKRDIDNMVSSCSDALTSAGIIADDSWQIVGRVTGVVGGIDKDNPRAEIAIIDF